jgi:hypothetical protein
MSESSEIRQTDVIQKEINVWAVTIGCDCKEVPVNPIQDDPTYEWCLEEDESATHILCDCEAIAYLRFRHLGQFFMEPSDYYDAPINRALHFIRSVGLIKG